MQRSYGLQSDGNWRTTSDDGRTYAHIGQKNFPDCAGGHAREPEKRVRNDATIRNSADRNPRVSCLAGHIEQAQGFKCVRHSNGARFDKAVRRVLFRDR